MKTSIEKILSAHGNLDELTRTEEFHLRIENPHTAYKSFVERGTFDSLSRLDVYLLLLKNFAKKRVREFLFSRCRNLLEIGRTGRGDLGHVVISVAQESRALQLKTLLRPGRYCNLVADNSQSDCAIVDENGVMTLTLAPRSAFVALEPTAANKPGRRERRTPGACLAHRHHFRRQCGGDRRLVINRNRETATAFRGGAPRLLYYGGEFADKLG